MYRPSASTTLTAAVAAAGALACFFIASHDPGRLFPIMAAAWLCACAIDMGYTVRHGSLVGSYERNPVLRACMRFGGLRAGVIATLAVEAGLVLSGSFIVLHEWDPLLFSVLCGAAAGVHVTGFLESRRFVGRLHAGTGSCGSCARTP